MVDIEESYRLSSFFQMTPDLVCIAGKDGFFKNINPAVINKLGYTEQELKARPIASFIHPDDQSLTSHERSALLNGKVLLNFQNRYITKTGNTVWLEWTSIYFADQEVVFAIAKDITKKKLVEQEVEGKYKRFKDLATHFKQSIEEDRKYLANEIHEELAQLAAILKMDINWMNSNAADLPAEHKERVEHALAIADLLIIAMRKISFAISPHMLEQLGLNATLEWYCKEFTILNGIPCSFESAWDEASVSQEVKIDFFRICQEALNISTYKLLTGNVKIRMTDTGTQLLLTIIDDGEGFDEVHPQQEPAINRMRERATSINGHLTIENEVGKGTTVRVTINKH